MSNDKTDFSLWPHIEEWSLTDAEHIITCYNRELLSDNSVIDSYTEKFEESYSTFTDKREYHWVYEDENFPVCDEYGEPINYIDHGDIKNCWKCYLILSMKSMRIVKFGSSL